MKMIGTRNPGSSKVASMLAALLIAGSSSLIGMPSDAQSIPIGLGLGLGRSLVRSAARHRSYNGANSNSGMYGAGGNVPGSGSGAGAGAGAGLPGYPTYYGYPNGEPPSPNSLNPYDPTASSQPGGAPVGGAPATLPPPGYPTAGGGYQVPYQGGQMNAFMPGNSGRSRSGSANRRAHSASIATFNKSIRYFNDQKFDQAMPLLSQALQQDPHMGSAYALLAVCQSRTGHFQDAMPNFQSAQTFGNHYDPLLYEEGMCAGRLHDWRTAEGCLEHFIAKHRDDSHVDEAQKALAIIQHNFDRQSDSDYLADAQKEGARRWGNIAAPLRVYIKENPNLRGYHVEFPAIVKQAFDEWSQGTNGKVAFVYTTNPSEAQITVSWTDNEADLGGADSRELGLTLTQFADGVIESADIKLLTLYGVCRDDVTEIFPQAKCVALHEIGHAMGLQHSSQPYDTMYPLVPPKGFEYSLTKRDLNTMTALYAGGDTQRTTMQPYKMLPQTELAAQRSK